MPSEAEMRLRERLSKLGGMKLLRGTKLTGELEKLQDQIDRLQEEPEPDAEAIWQSVELARHKDRPYTLDYVDRILDDFFEPHSGFQLWVFIGGIGYGSPAGRHRSSALASPDMPMSCATLS